jgi:ribosomal protein S18 acetylase RimI-like enzyme
MLNAISYPGDLERLCQFAENEFPSTFRYFQSHPVKESFQNHVLTLLYTRDGVDVGYAHLDRDPTSERVFFGVCVLPSAQGSGIGTKLIRAAMDYADAHGLIIYLTVDHSNSRARSLYLAHGFVAQRDTPAYTLFMRNPVPPCL